MLCDTIDSLQSRIRSVGDIRQELYFEFHDQRLSEINGSQTLGDGLETRRYRFDAAVPPVTTTYISRTGPASPRIYFQSSDIHRAHQTQQKRPLTSTCTVVEHYVTHHRTHIHIDNQAQSFVGKTTCYPCSSSCFEALQLGSDKDNICDSSSCHPSYAVRTLQ